MLGLPERVKRGSSTEKPFIWAKYQRKVRWGDFVTFNGGLFKAEGARLDSRERTREVVRLSPVQADGRWDEERKYSVRLYRKKTF